MVLAGVQREGGRQRDHVRAFFRQCLKQIGKAQVITNRAADGQAFAIIGHDCIARLHRCAFVILLAVWRRDVEHMNLAIARDLFARAIERNRRVANPLVAGDRLQYRAAVNEHAMRFGHVTQHRPCGAAGQLLGGCELLHARAAHEVEDFGQADPVRLFLAHSLFNQSARRRDIGALVRAGIHLDQRDFHDLLALGGKPFAHYRDL